MNITLHSHVDLEIIVVTGLISHEHILEIQRTIDTLPENKLKQVCIDSSQVFKFSASDTCFTTYISILLKLRSENVQLVLYGTDPITTRLLKLLKLEDMFKFVPTLEDVLNPTVKEPIH